MIRTLPTLALLALTLGLGACEGDVGPAGPAGQDGLDGSPGTDGADGSDGSDGADGQDGVDGQDGMDGANGQPGFFDSTWWVAMNGSSNAGTLTKRNQSWAVLAEFTSETNEGLAFDGQHNLVQAGDATGAVGLRTFCLPELGEGAFTDSRDREIAGSNTNLVNPKGIAIARDANLTFVADVGTSDIKVFGGNAAGDVAPIATTTLTDSAWDLAYDESADRLFLALTNGTIGVIDDYVANLDTASIDRIITPSNGTAPIGTNIHGIDYDASADILVVTDVGAANAGQDADFGVDGAIYVFRDASNAVGLTEPDRMIMGPSTMLGNPVDLVLHNGNARVAEKTQGKLLVFADIVSGESGDIAPDYAVDATAPESIAMVPEHDMWQTNASDILDPYTPLRGVYFTQNPGDDADLSDEGMVSLANRWLTSDMMAFSLTDDVGDDDDDIDVVSVENVTVGNDGTLYITYDAPSGDAGIAIVSDPRMRDMAEYMETYDRVIAGPNAGLIAPKGIESVDSEGILLVADIGTGTTDAAVLVFSMCAAGDVPPLASVDTGGGRPWDINHEPITDTLLAAFTNGTVGVYDNFSVDLGAGGPDRIITPAMDGTQVSVNLHSVRYDAASDTIILADVGAAGDSTDGALFTIAFGSTAEGLTEVTSMVSGPLSGLGNPVDIAFDGRDLYVAEKANGALYLYRDFLFADTSGGVLDPLTPDMTLAAPAVESVVLAPL